MQLPRILKDECYLLAHLHRFCSRRREISIHCQGQPQTQPPRVRNPTSVPMIPFPVLLLLCPVPFPARQPWRPLAHRRRASPSSLQKMTLWYCDVVLLTLQVSWRPLPACGRGGAALITFAGGNTALGDLHSTIPSIQDHRGRWRYRYRAGGGDLGLRRLMPTGNGHALEPETQTKPGRRGAR